MSRPSTDDPARPLRARGARLLVAVVLSGCRTGAPAPTPATTPATAVPDAAAEDAPVGAQRDARRAEATADRARTDGGAVEPPAPPPHVPEDEPNVRPGINDRYRTGSVDRFVARFEGKDREVAARKSEILGLLDLEPGMVVADVGAGTGLFTFDLAAAVGSSGRVYAVDVTPSFLDRLRARAAEEGADNVTVVEATAKDARLPADTLDLAFLCDVYHHLEYPRTYLASVYRALRPGGRLVVVDFRRDPKSSPKWVLSHVRADERAVRAEIASVGFRFEGTRGNLEQNYVLVFRKPAAGTPRRAEDR